MRGRQSDIGLRPAQTASAEGLERKTGRDYLSLSAGFLTGAVAGYALVKGGQGLARFAKGLFWYMDAVGNFPYGIEHPDRNGQSR